MFHSAAIQPASEHISFEPSDGVEVRQSATQWERRFSLRFVLRDDVMVEMSGASPQTTGNI